VYGTCPYPATELQSWFAEAPMSVTADFEIDSKNVTVTRGNKPSVVSDGQVLANAASKVTEKLQQITKLSPELLNALTYRGQKERGLFLSKTDSVKKEFLAEILGLEAIEKAVGIAQDNIKKLEIEREVRSKTLDLEQSKAFPMPPEPPDFSQRLESLRGDLSASDTAVADKTSIVRGIDAHNKKKNASEINSLKDTLYGHDITSDEIVRLKGLAAETQRRIDARVAEDDKRMASVRAKTAVASAAYHESMSAAKELATTQQKIVEKQKALVSTHCPTCHQAWTPNRTELEETIAALTARSEALSLVAAEHNARKQALDSVGAHEPDMLVAKLLQIKASVQEQLDTAVKNARQVAQARLDAIHEQTQAELAHAQKELDEAIEAREQIRKVIFQTEQKQNERVKWLNLKQENNKIAQNIVSLSDSLRETEKALALEQEFIKLAGREGFLGSIFDEVLEEIAAEANSILAKVPNVKHVTIRFASEVLTTKNTVKKSIVPIVSVDGHEATLSASLANLSAGLSGGMATSVELAVDLAVSAMISRRSGVNTKYLILDESFDGLGPDEKEAALEILRQHASDKLIIVVDHMPEFKEFFEKSIFVSSVAGRSVLTDERH